MDANVEVVHFLIRQPFYQNTTLFLLSVVMLVALKLLYGLLVDIQLLLLMLALYFLQTFTFKFSIFLYLSYVSFKKHMVGLFLICAINLYF